jgi:hypothetical protein
MPYVSGETPALGDYVKNKWEQPGTVTRVHAAQDGVERVSIKWDDGGIDLLFASSAEYSLISRKCWARLCGKCTPSHVDISTPPA